MKLVKSLLAWTLTVCLLASPFSGSIVFALNSASAPEITVNLNFSEYITPDQTIEVSYAAKGDATLASCDTRLEGKSVSTEASFSATPEELGLTNGVYTLVCEATDSYGEKAIEVVSFTVVDQVDLDFYYDENEVPVAYDPAATVATHAITPLEYSVRYGTTADGEVSVDDGLKADDYTRHGVQYYNTAFETKSVAGLPYQIFDVALNGKTDGEIAVRYTGYTQSGERIAFKAYNPATASWDTVSTFLGSESTSVALDVATYADNDTIHVMAILDYVTNGSDTMIWSTDPQHYTKFEDLNKYYYRVYEYAAEQYQNGNVGYIITTGDLVDDRPTASVAAAQWQVADRAMDYVDEAGMPNGLVSGNHDVGDFKKPDYSSTAPTADYSKFWETFPASRYNTQRWYGSSLNNNASHYDLITIGNVDFIVMYLGYGVETTEETIVWANNVLSKYSHRTAIVTTHEYLDAGAAIRSTASRAQMIFDEIVDPNPNVKAILCGHDDGSLCLEKTASDGRTVYELLCDYQFVEAEDPDFYDNPHYIGSVPHCCGDGYIRLMTVKGSTLSSVTYSPVTDRYNPYGDRENIQIDLGVTASERYIGSVNFSAYVVGEETDHAAVGNTAIVITKGDQAVYHHASYAEFPDQPEAGTMENVDAAALEALVAEAGAIDTTSYTAETVSAFQTALETATEAVSADDETVKTAFTALANAIGALKVQKETVDPATLTSMHKVDFTLSKWLNNDTSVYLTNSRSHIKATQTDAGGIHMTRSSASTNTWPSARYRTTNIVMKPVNGKVYLNLDVDADSAWCIYADITQGTISTTVRFNFAIENAFNSTSSDGFEGVFKGVYDVSEALTENGLDPSATFRIDRLILYIVPGDVTYDCIDFMTDTSDGTVDMSELNTLLEQVAAMNSADYTPSTWAALQKAVTAANNVKNDAVSAQADINLAALDLKKAVDKLKNVADIIPEPENSLLPADEGEWVPSTEGTMNIYRNSDNITVLQNTNGQWPNATYTFIENPYVTTVADHQITFDFTVGSESSILLLIDNSWVQMNTMITTNLSSANDIKSGTYSLSVPLSSIISIADKETVSIQGVRIFSVGAAESSAVVVRKIMVDDYVAPPPVLDTTFSLLPETFADTESPSTSGVHSVLPGGKIVINSPAEGYRAVIKPQTPTLFDLNTLNAIHMVVNSTVPFKMAFELANYNTPDNVKWLTTSDAAYSNIFTVTNDRVVPGSYDVFMEAKANCSNITDRSMVYMKSVTIVAGGEGVLNLSCLNMMKHDTVVWDENMTTFGPAAVPTDPYHLHASIEPPKVATKVNLLEKVGLADQYIVTGWQTYGNQALNLNINLSQTPYLYYSVALPAESNFTFALYNNSTNAPWLFFRDATGEGAYMNQGANNWDAYTKREQYATYSETGCIDLRDYRKNQGNNTWIVNQLNFYNSTGKNVVVNYMFFGSAPIDPVKGDANGDNKFDLVDAAQIYALISGSITSADTDAKAADVNGDGVVNVVDAMLAYRVASGKDNWPQI